MNFSQGSATHELFTVLRIGTYVIATAAVASGQATSHEASHDLPHQLLYIVDSDRGTSDSHELLFAVDPARKEIVKTYPTGSRPDIALSRDGSRLFVASESRVPEGPEGAGAGRLDVVDTATGATLASVNNPNRWVAMGPLYGSEMALSADGHWLYVYKSMPGPENTVSDSVAIFDTAANKFLPDTIPLPKCGASLLVPWPNGRALSVACFVTEDLRTMQFS